MSAATLTLPEIAAAPGSAVPAQTRSPVQVTPSRPIPSWWSATGLSREQALTLLTSPLFLPDSRKAEHQRVSGVRLLLDWLMSWPGTTWQDRWRASGADGAAANWLEVPAVWLRGQGYRSKWRQDALVGALPAAVSAELIRPSLQWLVNGGGARGGLLARNLEASRDPDGFARLNQHCAADPGISAVVAGQIRYLAAQVLAAKEGVSGRSQSVISSSFSIWRTPPDSTPKAAAACSTGYCGRWASSMLMLRSRCGRCARASRPPRSN